MSLRDRALDHPKLTRKLKRRHESELTRAFSNTEESFEVKRKKAKVYSPVASDNLKTKQNRKSPTQAFEVFNKTKGKHKSEFRKQNFSNSPDIMNHMYCSNGLLSSSGDKKRKHKSRKEKRKRNWESSIGTYAEEMSNMQFRNDKLEEIEQTNVFHETAKHLQCEVNTACSLNTDGSLKEYVFHERKRSHESNSQEHSPSDNCAYSTMSFLSGDEKRRKHKRKKKKEKRKKNGAFSTGTDVEERKEKPTCKSKSVDNHALCIPDYTLSSTNNSLPPSGEKMRPHKKEDKKQRKKEKVETNAEVNATLHYSEEQLKEAIRKANLIHETWNISDERLAELKAKGIKIRKGVWSHKELNLLRSNVTTFLERYKISTADELLGEARMTKKDRKYWKHFKRKTGFFFHIGRGIQRPLGLIYRCAMRIYDESNYIGIYTEKEEKELKRLHAVHGRDWCTVGPLMGRSRLSVCRKFLKLIDQEGTNVGSWTDEEMKRLKEAVHRVTNTPDDQTGPFTGFSWRVVAKEVQTRSPQQCRIKWLHTLWFEESASEKRWTEEDTRKLVTRLYRSGVTEECDIDWMEVKSEFEIDCSPYWLHKKWHHIKTRVPNYQLLDFEDAIDYLYQKYGKSNETSARDTE
ncbi:cyclin-D-binding Myb-like transcription factor 1 [Montipora capricornis]|uniref:cyclin-D-binding Myb-like transcription factor 1 n=1 Tax=Montipora capricornis TaxID=246305 RepID=UPI0035F21C98